LQQAEAALHFDDQFLKIMVKTALPLVFFFIANLCCAQSPYYLKFELGLLTNQSHQNDYQGVNSCINYSKPKPLFGILVGRSWNRIGFESGLNFTHFDLEHTLRTTSNYAISKSIAISYNTLNVPIIIYVPLLSKSKVAKRIGVDLFAGINLRYLLNGKSGRMQFQKFGSGRYASTINGVSDEIHYEITLISNVFTNPSLTLAAQGGTTVNFKISSICTIYGRAYVNMGLSSLSASVSDFKFTYFKKDNSFRLSEFGEYFSSSLKGDYFGLNLGCKINL
jgi:hypothetical protein